MASFSDLQSKEWEIRLDAPAIVRIREDLDPKFLLGDSDGGENTWIRLESDPVLLSQVIYVLCAKQRVDRGIDDNGFYDAVHGDALDAAAAALHKAIMSFIPRRTRDLLEASAEKRDRIRQIGTQKVLEKLNDPKLEEQILANLDQQLDAAISRLLTPSTSATSSPDSSASTPAA